jgi:hypothetical protein
VKEIEGEEFHLSPMHGRILLNAIQPILESNNGKDLEKIKSEFMKEASEVGEAIINEMFSDLKDFIITVPRIPDPDKEYRKTLRLNITNESSLEEIIEEVISKSEKSELAELVLYIYRKMDSIDWLPFIKAAIERNPVCFTDLSENDISGVYSILLNMPDESIYNGERLALPDEVWNFKRGDGIEKSLLMAAFMINRDNSSEVIIKIENNNVNLIYLGKEYHFNSQKNFTKSIRIHGTQYQIN